MIECIPTESDDVLNVACAEAFRVAVPKEVLPSRNMIVPVGVPAVVEVTVAVRVTD